MKEKEKEKKRRGKNNFYFILFHFIFIYFFFSFIEFNFILFCLILFFSTKHYIDVSYCNFKIRRKFLLLFARSNSSNICLSGSSLEQGHIYDFDI